MPRCCAMHRAAAMLPRNVPLARDSMGLAHLSYEAFGAAANEVVPRASQHKSGLNAQAQS
jgi:hypothetical protein